MKTLIFFMVLNIMSFTGFSSDYQEMPVYSDCTFKPYMDYRTVTDQSSLSWKLISKAKHEKDGTLSINDYTCIVLGQKYGHTNDKFLLVVDGKTYKTIIVDEKKYSDTLNNNGWIGKDRHVVEFVVDTDILDNQCKLLGDCNELMKGKVEKIYKIKE